MADVVAFVVWNTQRFATLRRCVGEVVKLSDCESIMLGTSEENASHCHLIVIIK